MYKMHLISAGGYKDANVELLTIKATSEISVSMKDVVQVQVVVQVLKTYLI